MPEVLSEQVGVQNRKLLVSLEDGSAVESVVYREDTLCISTQVGCAVRCPFCASGSGGLTRGLSFSELTSQVELAWERGHRVRRVTLSGIGEPLHNHEASLAFLHWARARSLKVSVTTSGGPLHRLEEWLRLPHNGLTISVHAGTEATRSELVPKGPALAALFALLGDVAPTLTRQRRKKLALAYLLLAGRNDSDAELDAFAARAIDLGARVHLYAYNPVPSSSHQALERDRYEAAYARLSGAGLSVRMSSRARVESIGGCGTLVARARSCV